MPDTLQLTEFANLIDRERVSLLAQWRLQVRKLPSARNLDVPTLNDHIPSLLDEISAALIAGAETTIPETLAQKSPPAHGVQRLADGFDIEEVVAEYNILRATIHDLAEIHSLNIQGSPFRILNRVLDGAIGLAVQAYAAERAREIQQRRDEYLAFVVHDLRTPLSAATLAATILELPRGETGAESRAQLLNILARNLAQLDKLIAKIIEESVQILAEEGQRLEPRTFDLWPLVERLGEELRPKLQEAGIAFHNTVSPDLTVYADAQLVKRIFQNLVANAIEYTAGGRIEVGATSEPAGVECCVKDNGAGIPPDRIDSVFDKLESDPDNANGVGLGLAIVKSFVELHGGSVSVESEVGVGSTFRFTLPAKV